MTETNALALSTKTNLDPLVLDIWDIISTVKNHIEKDHCEHCKEILSKL